MRVYKPSYSKALPQNARMKWAQDGEYIILRDRCGRNKKCRVIETDKGKRVLVESSCWTVVFRDPTGAERRVQAYDKKTSSDALAKKICALVRHRERGETLQ